MDRLLLWKKFLKQGCEVFAVPGPMTAVTSQGTHQLLKQGARLVTSVDDILDELSLTPTSLPQAGGRDAAVMAPPLADAEQRILACVGSAASLHLDAIAAHSGLSLPEVSSSLLQLEVKPLIRQLPGKQFVRAGR